MLPTLEDASTEADFLGDAVIAIGALRATRELGLEVPNSVRLLGLNGMKMASWREINLTTIMRPIAVIVKSQVDLMVSTINDSEREPGRRIFACTVIGRGTLKNCKFWKG